MSGSRLLLRNKVWLDLTPDRPKCKLWYEGGTFKGDKVKRILPHCTGGRLKDGTSPSKNSSSKCVFATLASR